MSRIEGLSRAREGTVLGTARGLRSSLGFVGRRMERRRGAERTRVVLEDDLERGGRMIRLGDCEWVGS